MNSYYLNNVRGFKNTILEFEKVNFLVGENSTGKTSLINLINLLNNPNFWLNLDFNVDNIQFGTFEDLLSKNSTSKYFSIGRFTEDNKSENIEGNILKFKNDNGMPSLYEHFLCSDESFLVLRFENDIIKYNYTSLNSLKSLSTFSDKIQTIVKYYEKTKLRSNRLKHISFKKEISPFLFSFQKVVENVPGLKDKFKFFFPFFRGNRISTIAPIRAKPKQIYLGTKIPYSPEGDHTPFIFKSLFDKREETDLLFALNNFGKESGLFDSFEVKTFGKKKTSPFEIDIVKNNKRFNLLSVGYGVSQIFPILVDILFQPKGTFFTIQQPEVHLHPKAQAAFGELIYLITQSDDKSFIIETHSDFLIDRFRYTLYKNENKISSKVLFFENIQNSNIINEIKINNNGSYSLEQPAGFRSFFINESIKLFNI